MSVRYLFTSAAFLAVVSQAQGQGLDTFIRSMEDHVSKTEKVCTATANQAIGYVNKMKPWFSARHFYPDWPRSTPAIASMSLAGGEARHCEAVL